MTATARVRQAWTKAQVAEFESAARYAMGCDDWCDYDHKGSAAAEFASGTAAHYTRPQRRNFRNLDFIEAWAGRCDGALLVDADFVRGGHRCQCWTFTVPELRRLIGLLQSVLQEVDPAVIVARHQDEAAMQQRMAEWEERQAAGCVTTPRQRKRKASVSGPAGRRPG
jgi:hypothetical protein